MIDDIEELWTASTYRRNERRREQRRWEWVRFFDRMAASHAALSEDYSRRAEALVQENPRARAREEYVHDPYPQSPQEKAM
ncbi:MAG: hypothetical protein M3N18_06015 [Actinomycetota bacterium]|nr:hypothetical protein [Actinomycetota bacterium]